MEGGTLESRDIRLDPCALSPMPFHKTGAGRAKQSAHEALAKGWALLHRVFGLV